jgi:hypothetical protein
MNIHPDKISQGRGLKGQRAIKLKKMRVTGLLARMKDRRGACWLLVGKLAEKRHFEDLDIGW